MKLSSSRKSIPVFLIWLLATQLLQADEKNTPSVRSPDGRIVLSIRMAGSDLKELPSWTAEFRGRTLFSNCRLGLEIAGGGEVLSGAVLKEIRHRSVDDEIPVLFGKTAVAKDRFNEIRLTVQNAHQDQIDLVFRCYDDAVALRYEVTAIAGANSITLLNEGTSFELNEDPTAYAQYLENFTTSHEHPVSSVKFSQLPRGVLIDMPLTLAWPDQTCVAITEAALRHYAGMAMMAQTNRTGGLGLVCRLSPRADGTKVVRPLPMLSPWRVALIADHPGALLESQTLYALNEPSVIKDTSWIKPGKITFHWWNGDVYDGSTDAPILSLGVAKKYIDFCARNSIAAHSLTSTENTTTPWYQQSKPGVEPGPDTDVTRPREGFDLQTIRRYGESKGVRLWTWVHQAALKGRVEEAFTAFEKMGWSGMMVDFFDRDDQEMVEYAESILEAASRHHILIHLHGIWKPTGLQRTYPNLMNHEGALNLEYLKWSDRCTPQHDLMMAFTRLIAGPMDYHLGGFRAVSRSEFKPKNIAPNVLGTRGHMLAMYVCYDNPMPMIADYPTAYDGQAGFEFLRLVPTWWDDTKIVSAVVGETLVTARRKGSTWFLGGLSAGPSRLLKLPMSFLGQGRFRARIWKDGSNVFRDRNQIEVEVMTLSSASFLKVLVGEDGGFVAEISATEP